MVKINERFYINADNNQYILQEKVTIQDEKSENYGKEVMRNLGYYVSLEGCLNGILKTKLREFIGKQKENTIEELLDTIRKLQKELEKFNNI